MTSFVGRSRELDELRSLFREGKRFITLIGIGGIGKTRLALELGWSANDLGWASVCLVELASLTPDLVDTAVLESVGGGSSRSPLEAAAEYLRDATVLLVLDCCEPQVRSPGQEEIDLPETPQVGRRCRPRCVRW